jgi:hypothetical protein
MSGTKDAFSETGEEVVLTSLSITRTSESGYCNKRTRISTSKTMSRVAVRTLPIRNALRLSYLNPLLLLRPIVVLLPARSPW